MRFLLLLFLLLLDIQCLFYCLVLVALFRFLPMSIVIHLILMLLHDVEEYRELVENYLRGAAAVEYGLADGVLCVAFRMRDAEGEGEPQ